MQLDISKSKTDYPYISTLFLLLFCGYVIIWYLQLGERRPELGAIRFEFYYAAFLTILSIFAIKKSNLGCPLYSYILVYLFLLLIQVALSYDSQTSWNIFVNRVIKFGFMGFFIVVFVRSPKGLTFLLGAFLLVCMKMGQEGLWGTVTGSMLWESQGIMRLHGATSLYAHPNSFSGNAIGVLPFIYYLFPLCRPFVKGVFILQLTLAGNIILHTGSRTGYVALIAFISYIFFKTKRKSRYIILLFIISVCAISYVQHQYIDRFESIYTLQEEEGQSSHMRIEIIKDAVQIFLHHPFGVGVGAFPAIRNDTFGRIQDTHNLYLEVATNLGIQGFIIFFLLVYKMSNMLNMLKNDISEQIRVLQERLSAGQSTTKMTMQAEKHVNDLKFMMATCSALILFIVLRLTLGLFGMDLYEIYWWFALGITISIFNMNKHAKLKTEELLTFHNTEA
jgi:hypothetical protein